MSRINVSSKTMSDGNKVRVVTKIKGEYDIIYQRINHIFKDRVSVLSGRGKAYTVKLSDKLIYSDINIEVGDIAEIKTFDDGWLVTNIIKQEKEPVLTPEEEERELEKQLMEIKEMYGEY